MKVSIRTDKKRGRARTGEMGGRVGRRVVTGERGRGSARTMAEQGRTSCRRKGVRVCL